MNDDPNDAVVKCYGVPEPFLACERCGGFIVQLEEGDYLSVLAQMVADHECEAGGPDAS